MKDLAVLVDSLDMLLGKLEVRERCGWGSET